MLNDGQTTSPLAYASQSATRTIHSSRKFVILGCIIDSGAYQLDTSHTNSIKIVMTSGHKMFYEKMSRAPGEQSSEAAGGGVSRQVS